MFSHDDDKLIYRYDAETLQIQSWGPNAFRIRAAKQHTLPVEDWALSDTPPSTPLAQFVTSQSDGQKITNGNITATVTKAGKVTIINTTTKKVILEEFVRTRKDVLDPMASALEVEAREFKPHPGSPNYHLTYRLTSLSREEKIYGMGQYQQPYLNIKGCDLELAQRNSQASVPFLVSSLGYGLLWNNPGVGRAVLGMNVMSFEAYSTKVLDIWVVIGDTPSEIVGRYANVTGKVSTRDYALCN